jgi:hypothetical protein
MAQHTNANLATSSFDRASGATTQPGVEPYNDFSVQTIGGPIIQGQISKIKVSEIYFPYDIPTIVAGRNDAMVISAIQLTNTAPGVFTTVATGLSVTITSDWYSPAELVAAVQTASSAALASAGIPVTLAFNYDFVGQYVTVANTATWNAGALAVNYLFQLLPGSILLGANKIWSTPQLLTTLGLRNIFLNQPVLAPIYPGIVFTSPTLVPALFPNGGAGLPNFPSGYHPIAMRSTPLSGCYTDFIDIISHKLCEAQYIRDSTTNQVAVRKDLLIRLYIADESSTTPVFVAPVYTTLQGDISGDLSGGPLPTGVVTNSNVNLGFGDPIETGNYPAGCRPFVIHRQFVNPKVIKSTLENSASSLDLALYDMYGLPVPLPPTAAQNGEVLLQAGSRDYGITFHVEESESGGQANTGYRY